MLFVTGYTGPGRSEAVCMQDAVSERPPPAVGGQKSLPWRVSERD
jgi:hypothetical protein